MRVCSVHLAITELYPFGTSNAWKNQHKRIYHVVRAAVWHRRALANIAIFVDLFAAVPSANASAPASAPAASAQTPGDAMAPSAAFGPAPAPAALSGARRKLVALAQPKQLPYVDLGITFDFFQSLQLPVDAPVRASLPQAHANIGFNML